MKQHIYELLKERNFNQFLKLKFEDLQVYFKSFILTGNKKLKEYELDPSNINELSVVIFNKEIANYFNDSNKKITKIKETNVKKESEYINIMKENRSPKLINSKRKRLSTDEHSPIKNKEKVKNFIEEDKNENKLWPILSNKFNIVFPDTVEICRMTHKQLKDVKGFTVSNEFAKIRFEESLNLNGVDLNEVILMELMNVEIYPKKNIPKPGEGFNKPAEITIYKMFDFDEEDVYNFKREIEKKKGVFLKYNSDKGYIKFWVKEWIK